MEYLQRSPADLKHSREKTLGLAWRIQFQCGSLTSANCWQGPQIRLHVSLPTGRPWYPHIMVADLLKNEPRDQHRSDSTVYDLALECTHCCTIFF